MIVDIWDLKKLLTEYQARARARSEERANMNDDTSFETRVTQEILIDLVNTVEVLKRRSELLGGEPLDLTREIALEKARRQEEAEAKRTAELAEAARIRAENEKKRGPRPPFPTI
jgi:hypothetical protein